MAKRFIDTGMFDDPWFMDLSPDLKCFWMYAITKCNHAGILVLNKTLARIQIGCGDIDALISEIGDRMVLIDDEKYFIPKFIDFQYGTLKENNRVHVSVLDTLKKYNIKDLISPLQGAMDKDKDKDLFKKADFEKDIRQIDVVFEQFKASVEKKEQDIWIESLYRKFKIKQGMMTDLVLDFTTHIKIAEKIPNSIKDFKSHFYNWLNIQQNMGKLDQYRSVKAPGAH